MVNHSPDDHSIVTLSTLKDEPLSDFINANFIHVSIYKIAVNNPAVLLKDFISLGEKKVMCMISMSGATLYLRCSFLTSIHVQLLDASCTSLLQGFKKPNYYIATQGESAARRPPGLRFSALELLVNFFPLHICMWKRYLYRSNASYTGQFLADGVGAASVSGRHGDWYSGRCKGTVGIVTPWTWRCKTM